MEISNSNNIVQSSASVQVTQTSSSRRAADQRREVESVEREQQNTSSQQRERFDADQNAIAFVEQELATTQQNNQNNSPENNQTNEKNSQSGYDQPSRQNLSAVNAYQAVDNLSQRDSIQQVFGVDLLA